MAGLRYQVIRSRRVNRKASAWSEDISDVISNGQEIKLRNLIQEDGVCLNCYNAAGMTPLGVAAQMGHAGMVKALIERDADINKADFYGLTALQYAAEFGHCDVLQSLVDAGGNINWMDVNNDGLSALHIAACKGQTQAAKTLISAGALVNLQDINGVSILHCAAANGNMDVVECLIKAGAKVNVVGSTTERTPLFQAVDVGDKEMVNILLYFGGKANVVDGFGMTPLSYACFQRKADIAFLLLSWGAKPNLADKKGNIPLHYVARRGHLELAKKLIESGSQLDVLNEYADSPLHLAVRMRHVNIIQELVDKGCDAGLMGDAHHNSVTALHLAVSTYDDVELFEEVLRLLIKGGCDLDVQAGSSLPTPLYMALDQNKVSIAQVLLQHGADPNVEGPYEISILHKACQREQYEVIETLLHTNIDWQNEAWLDSDKHTCGINLELLDEYEENVPMALHNKWDLLFRIQEMHHNPSTLLRLCRSVIRRCMRRQLYIKIASFNPPKRLEDFLMLRII